MVIPDSLNFLSTETRALPRSGAVPSEMPPSYLIEGSLTLQTIQALTMNYRLRVTPLLLPRTV